MLGRDNINNEGSRTFLHGLLLSDSSSPIPAGSPIVICWLYPVYGLLCLITHYVHENILISF